MFESEFHVPVLVAEVLSVLEGAEHVLDCTLGGGGHSAALLERGARVTAIDRDAEALDAATQRLQRFIQSGRFRVIQGDFTRIEDVPEIAGLSFGGILADLGVSSHQIDADARGFSFRPGVALDMRMTGTGRTAADVLNETPLDELTAIFRDYGDEPRGRRLAAAVVRRRSHRAFRVSDDLVDAIRGAFGPSTGPSDFARLFQSVRIAVNNELTGLEQVLPALRDRLTPGGVLSVITYHSGEDRLVKHAMRDWSTACHCPPLQPLCTCGGVALGAPVTRKGLRPTAQEIASNPRSRSAQLRSWRKHA